MKTSLFSRKGPKVVFKVEPLEQRILLSATPVYAEPLETPEALPPVIEAPQSEVTAESGGELFQSSMDETGLALEAELTVLEEALGDWLALIPSGSTLLPGEASAMFDLSVETGALGFTAAGIEDTAGLVERLREMGFSLEAIAGGYSDGEGTIADAGEGILLVGSGTFELFTDRAVVGGLAGLGLNNSLTGLARGLGDDVSLQAETGWKASLTLQLFFQLDSEGHLQVREGTRLDLSIKTDEVALSGTLGGGALALTPGGKLEAEYQLSMALQEDLAESTLEVVVATPETHFETRTTGSAQVSLTGTAGVANWILEQTLETVGGEEGEGSTVVVNDSMRLFLPLPGLAEPVELTGQYDEEEGFWLLSAEGVQWGQLGEVNLFGSLSTEGLEGVIVGFFDAPFLIGPDGEALRTEFSLGFDANRVEEFSLEEKSDFTLRRADGVELFSMPETLLTWQVRGADLTAEALPIELLVTSHEATFGSFPEGVNLSLKGNESRAALSGEWVYGEETMALTVGELRGEIETGLEFSAINRSFTLELLGAAEWWGVLAGVDLSLEVLTANQAMTALAGILRWNQNRVEFAAAEQSLTGMTEFDRAWQLHGTKLLTRNVAYEAGHGWSGEIEIKAGLGYVWQDSGGLTGQVTDRSGDGTAFAAVMDLADRATNVSFDGITVSQGRRLEVILPALEFAYDWDSGLPDTWGVVDEVEIRSRAFGPDLVAQVDGAEVNRYFLQLPGFSMHFDGSVTVGNDLVLENPVFASEGLALHHPESGPGLQGSITLSSAVGGLAAGINGNDRLTVAGGRAEFRFSPVPGTSSFAAVASTVTYENDLGEVLTLTDVPLVAGADILQASHLRGNLGDGTPVYLESFVVGPGGTVTIPAGEVVELADETMVLADGWLPFSIVRAELLAGETELYQVSGYFDFSVFQGLRGGTVAVVIDGETILRGDQLVQMVVRSDAQGLRPENSGAISLQIAQRTVGNLAEIDFDLPLGEYLNGTYQSANDDGEVSMRFRSIMSNPAEGAWTAPLASLMADGETLRATAELMVDLQTFQFGAEGVELALEIELSRLAGGGFRVSVPVLGTTTEQTLTVSPVSGVTIQFVDAQVDFTATGSQPLVAPARVEATVNLDTVGLLGQVQGLVIGANGVLSAPGALRIEMGGLDDANLLQGIRWPNWLPIQVEAFVLQWRNFNADWTDFVAVLSGQVRVDFGETKSTNFAGAITGLTLDFGKLSEGKFPFIRIDEVALEVSGFVLGLNAQGRAILGMLRLDAEGKVLPSTDLTTPVDSTVLYAAVDVEVTIKGIGVRVYFGLSEYGPLSFYVSAGAPLPVGGKTGFVLGGLRGGIQLFSETEAITDPRDLASGNFPQVTPLAQQNFFVWRQGFHNQLANQVATVTSPDFLLDFVTAPFRIEGGATFYNVYTQKNAFSVDVDVILDSSGRLTLVGRLQTFSINPSSKTSKGLSDIKAWFHFDIADAPDGEVTILANIKKEGVFGKLNLNLYGMLDIDLGATFDYDNPPTALLENIRLRLLGGISTSVLSLGLARFEGIVEWGASLSEARMYLGFTGDVYLVGLEDVFGPANAGAGRFEIYFDENEEVQMVGAVEIGDILNFDLGDVAGFTLGGQAVMRVNTTHENRLFEIPSLTDGEGNTIREVSLAAQTSDFFIEGALGLRAAGYEFIRQTGQMGVGFEEGALRVFAVGELVNRSIGEIDQLKGLSESFFLVEFEGIAPGVAGVSRLRDGEASLVQNVDFVAGGNGLLQLRGDFEIGVNTTGREILLDIPTENEAIFGAPVLNLTAGLVDPNGVEGAPGPWFRMAGQGSLDLLSALTAEGDFYLGTNLQEASVLEYNGAVSVVVEGQTLLAFDAEGRFRMDEQGLYGYAAKTTAGEALLLLPGGAVPVTLNGQLGLAINTTGEEQELNDQTLIAGKYARLQHEGTISLEGFTFSGRQSLEVVDETSGVGAALLLDGTLEARIGNQPVLAIGSSGVLRIASDGLYGRIGLNAGVTEELSAELGVKLEGEVYFEINTTNRERNGLPANLGGRIGVEGALIIGENGRIEGNHTITMGDDQITFDLNGEALLQVENEEDEMVEIVRVPLVHSFTINVPVIQETLVLDLTDENGLFAELGFQETATVTLEINTSTVATEERPAGPYLRLKVEGGLEHSDQTLEGTFYLYQDLRTIRGEADFALTLQAGDTPFFIFEGQAGLQFGFSGVAGFGRMQLKEALIDGELGNLADLDFVLSFNSSNQPQTIVREELDDVTLAAGPYFRMEAQGALDLQGVIVNGSLLLEVDGNGLSADVDGQLLVVIPEIEETILSFVTQGSLRLNGAGLYGVLELTGTPVFPSFLDLTIDPASGFLARLEVNTTGEAQALPGDLELEAGNYARVILTGEISQGLTRMSGDFVLEVVDNDLEMRVRADTSLFIPAIGELAATTIYSYSIHGALAIRGNGVVGVLTSDETIEAPQIDAFADFELDLELANTEFRFHLNTTNEEAEIDGVQLEAGRYARLVTDSVIQVGVLYLAGTSSFEVGATGVKMDVRAINSLQIPSIQGADPINLASYTVNGSLLIAAGGVVGFLETIDMLGQADTTALGFTLPLVANQVRAEINFTGEEVVFEGRTLEAGNYAQVVYDGVLTVELGPFAAGWEGTYRFRTGEDRLLVFLDVNSYIDFPSAEGEPTERLLEAPGTGVIQLTAKGLSGFIDGKDVLDFGALQHLGIDLPTIDTGSETGRSFEIFVNTTREEVEVDFDGVTRSLAAKDFFGVAYNGTMGLGLDGADPILFSSGENRITLAGNGVEIQTLSITNLLGVEIGLDGIVELSTDGIVAVFDPTFPQISLGEVFTLNGDFQIAINTTNTAREYTIPSGSGEPRTVHLAANSFRILVEEADVQVGESTLLSGSFYFSRDANGVWRAEVGAGDSEPFIIAPLPGVEGTAIGFLAEDGTHSLVGQATTSVGVPELAQLQGLLSFNFSQATTEDTPVGLLTLDGEATILGTTIPFDGTIEREGREWTARFSTESFSPYGLDFAGEVELHYDGETFQNGLLKGTFDFGGLEITGEHRLEVVDGQSRITLDGNLIYQVPGLDGPVLDIFKAEISGLLLGSDGTDPAQPAGWYGAIDAILSDEIDIAAKLQEIGIGVASTELTATLRLNTTGAAQTVTFPNETVVELEAGDYTRVLIEGVYDIGLLVFNGEFVFEREGDGAFIGLNGDLRLRTPSLGSLPEQNLARQQINGVFQLFADGFAGRVDLVSGTLDELPEWLAGFTPRMDHVTWLEINTTGREVTVGDDQVFEAERAFALYAFGGVSLFGYETINMNGDLLFEVRNGGVSLRMDTNLRIGIPANEDLDAFVTRQVVGDLLIDARGVAGILYAEGDTVAGNPDWPINFSDTSLAYMFLNTTGEEVVFAAEEITLAADDVVGYRAVADMAFPLGGFTGDFDLVMTPNSFLISLNGELTVLRQTFTSMGEFRADAEGLVFLMEGTLPGFSLLDGDGPTLNGRALALVNTRGSDYLWGEGENARLIASGTELVLVEDLVVQLTPDLRVSGEMGFTRTENGYAGAINPEKPLTLAIPGIFTEVNGFINLPDEGSASYDLTSVTTISLGTADLGLAGEIRLTASDEALPRLRFAGNVNGGVELASVEGDIEVLEDGFSVRLSAESLQVAGFAAGGTVVLRYFSETEVLRLETEGALTASLPGLGQVELEGYVQSDGDIHLTGDVALAVGDSRLLEANGTIAVVIDSSDRVEATFAGNLLVFGQTLQEQTLSGVVNSEGLVVTGSSSLQVAQYATAGDWSLRFGSENDTPYLRLETVDGQRLTVQDPILGEVELTGFVDTRQLQGSFTGVYSYNFSTGSGATEISVALGGTLGVTYSVAEVSWALDLGGNYAITALGQSASDSFQRSWSGDVIDFVLEGVYSLAGFDLSGKIEVLISSDLVRLNIPESQSLLLSHPVFGEIAFHGYYNSSSDFLLTGNATVDTGTGAFVGLNGTGAFTLNPDGITGLFTGNLVVDGSSYTLSETSFSLDAERFVLTTTPLSFDLGGFALGGSYTIEITHPEGAVLPLASLSVNQASLVIPALGESTVSGTIASDGTFQLDGSIALQLGDRDFVSLEGLATLDFNNTNFSAAISGGVWLLGVETAGVSATGSVTPTSFALQLNGLTTNLSGQTVEGGLGLRAEVIGGIPVITATVGENETSLTLDSPFFGDIDFRGDIDATNRTVSLGATVAFAWQASSDQPDLISLEGETDFDVVAGAGGFTLQARHLYAIQALGFSQSLEVTAAFEENALTLGVNGEFSFAGVEFSGPLQLRVTSENFTLETPEGTSLNAAFFGATLQLEGSWTGSTGNGIEQIDVVGQGNLTLGNAQQVALSGTVVVTLDEKGITGTYTGTVLTPAGSQTVNSLAFSARPGEFLQLAATPLQVELGGYVAGAELVYRYENRDGQDHHLFALPMQPGATALHFQNQATIALPGSLSLTGGYTVETWIKLDSVQGDQALLSATGGNFGTSNYLHLLIRNGRAHIGHFNDDLTGETVLATGEWIHVAFTYDAATLERRIYLNGQLEARDLAARALTALGNGPLAIGQFTGNRFNGAMDNFRIWEGPVAGDEIARRANLVLPGDTPGLALGLPFDEGGGTELVPVGSVATLGDIAVLGDLAWTRDGRTSANFAEGGHIVLPDSVQLSGGYTVSAWVRLNEGGQNGDQAILARSGGGTEAGNYLHLLVRNGKAWMGHFSDDLEGNTTLPVGEWVHLSFIYDADTLQRKIYVNGQLDAQDTAAQALTETGNGPLRVGIFGGSGLNASLDDLRIYDQALDASRAEALPESRPTEDDAGLLLALPLDEGNGQMVNVLSPAPAGLNVEGTLEWFVGDRISANFADGAQISLPETIRMAGGYTVSTWVWLNEGAQSGDQAILGATGGAGWASNYLHLLVRDGRAWQGHFADDLGGNTVLPTEQWVHLAFTYNAETLERRIYVNGQLDAQDTAARALTEAGNGALRVGTFQQSGLNAWLDDLRISRNFLDPSLAALLPQTRPQGNESGLLLALPFDDGSGQTVRPVQTNPTALTVNGALGWSSNLNFAADFSNGGRIQLPDSVELDGGYTVSAWVRLNSGALSGDQAILSRSGTSGGPGNLLHLLVRNGRAFSGHWADDLTGQTELPQDEWVHLTFTYDAQTQERRIYVNGQLDAQDTTAVPLTENGNGPLFVGLFGASGFDGNMREVRVYDQALTAATVAGLPESAAQPGANGWVMGLPLDEDSGSEPRVQVAQLDTLALQGNAEWLVQPNPVGGSNGFTVPGIGTVNGAGYVDSNGLLRISGTAQLDTVLGQATGQMVATSATDFAFRGEVNVDLGLAEAVRFAGQAKVLVVRGAFGDETSFDFTGSVQILGQTVLNGDIAMEATENGFAIRTGASFNLGGFSAQGQLYLSYEGGDQPRFTVGTEVPPGSSRKDAGSLSLQVPVLGSANLTGALVFTRIDGQWVESSRISGQIQANIRHGNNALNANFAVHYVGGSSPYFNASYSGNLTLLGLSTGISGNTVIQAGQNTFTFTTDAAARFASLSLQGTYSVEIGANYLRATASGVTFNLPGLSNSRVNVTVDSRGTFQASGDIDIKLGDAQYAAIEGTLRFSASANNASATFFYTARVANQEVSSAPFGHFVNLSDGNIRVDLARSSGNFLQLSLFDFNARLETLSFQVGATGLFVEVGGGASYHRTGGGNLSGFIDLRNGGLSYAFNGQFSVIGSVPGAQASATLSITMRSPLAGESGIGVSGFQMVIFGHATGSGSALGQTVSVSSGLDLSRWRLTFSFLGFNINITL
ncbi:MAG: LEPR-XLL domain-containing protein [Opitutales bacterium]|nr:LEPR-XLL domain-containing protein [Opitutales bacterium]